MTRPSRARLDAVTPRHAAVLSQVWFNQGLSRSDLHARTETRLRTIGSLVEDLVSWGLLAEGEPRAVGVGRPQVPLAIDSQTRNVLGVSLTAQRAVLVKVALDGRPVEPPVTVKARGVDALVAAAAEIIRAHADAQTLAIGAGLTGLVDDVAGEWLLSPAHTGKEPASLKPLMKAAGDVPISINNELHALSASSRLAGRLPSGDSLLMLLDDGRIAASILINGKPNRGSVMAANELGHMAMPVKVERCYCGQIGCIERIFSSEYLRSLGGKQRFEDALSNGIRASKDASGMVDLLCRTVANAINLVRPATLIVSSPFAGCGELVGAFEQGLSRYVLDVLHERLTVEWQPFDSDQSALCAASLPLAMILDEAANSGGGASNRAAGEFRIDNYWR